MSASRSWWVSGITGFSCETFDPDVRRRVAQWAHEVARLARGSLATAPTGDVATFDAWELTVEWTTAGCWILAHRMLPYVAATAEAPVPGRPLTSFVPVPSPPDASEWDLVALMPEELGAAVSRAKRAALTAVERTQLDYWDPATVGEAAFNWWD